MDFCTLCILGLAPTLLFILYSYYKQSTQIHADCLEWDKRGIGLYLIFQLIERPIFTAFLLLVAPLAFSIHLYYTGVSLLNAMLIFILPILSLVILFGAFLVQSHIHDSRPVNQQLQDELIIFKDQELKNLWKGKRMPIETCIEAYQNQKIDFQNDDVMKVLQYRYELFKFSFTMSHMKGIWDEIFIKLFQHERKHDQNDVANVYNRGNDFYGYFMDDRMLYSSGIFENLDEDLHTAQERKLHKICNMLQLKEGEEHLDFGCGWGALINFAAKNYGTKSTGITLSQEQANFVQKKFKENKVEGKANVQVINAWDVPLKKYDKISCVEMSEHIGIKDYQKFMHHVKDRLKDDGIFYLQIAGLRRAWQYEDLVWGLFMGKYIFPGADASCPLAWVMEQVERAGFEVRHVENNGIHYAITIQKWYENWVKNKQKVVEKYSVWWYRNWAIFLAWSTLIAYQGSSTVWMISMTKNLQNDKRSRSYPENSKEQKPTLDRTKLFILDRNNLAKKQN